MNKKKILWILLGVLDLGIVTFLFVVHIVMLSHVIGKTPLEVQLFAKGEGLFPYLAGHLDVYGYAFVIPLFVVLAANIVGLVIYIKKVTKKEKVSVKGLNNDDLQLIISKLSVLQNDNPRIKKFIHNLTTQKEIKENVNEKNIL